MPMATGAGAARTSEERTERAAAAVVKSMMLSEFGRSLTIRYERVEVEV